MRFVTAWVVILHKPYKIALQLYVNIQSQIFQTVNCIKCIQQHLIKPNCINGLSLNPMDHIKLNWIIYKTAHAYQQSNSVMNYNEIVVRVEYSSPRGSGFKSCHMLDLFLDNFLGVSRQVARSSDLLLLKMSWFYTYLNTKIQASNSIITPKPFSYKNRTLNLR